MTRYADIWSRRYDFLSTHEKRSNFTGSLGFVLAAAGSAVGLGNIWRFPYLAAKGGGGVFIFVYIILALTSDHGDCHWEEDGSGAFDSIWED